MAAKELVETGSVAIGYDPVDEDLDDDLQELGTYDIWLYSKGVCLLLDDEEWEDLVVAIELAKAKMKEGDK